MSRRLPLVSKLSEVRPFDRSGSGSALVWASLLALALQAIAAESPTPAASPAAGVDFQRDIRPILADHCFKCHGPDENTRKGGLRLDVAEQAAAPAKSGKRAVVPGQVESSELVRRILTKDDDDRMPPAAAKRPLTDAQKDQLQRWIAGGAVYQPHWAFTAPRRPAVPPVKDAAWVHNPIDAFILARLEREGLHPSPPADRQQLVRRLYFDLIGLPPTPAEADEFVNDTAPDALDRLVNRLLASPHYGERWARRWMDLARYADTNGYEKDRPRTIWPWRDWLIGALNADMPFDQFTVEQIAGDLLPDATPAQRVATGFHRNTMLNEEGGIDPREYHFYSVVDRVGTTSTTWLGLTMGCARCHAHKYDPISQREFYRFSAFLNNADEPTVEVEKPEITKQRTEKLAEIAKREARLSEEFPPAEDWRWDRPALQGFSTENGGVAERLTDGSYRLDGPGAEKDIYSFAVETALTNVTLVRVEAIPDGAWPRGGAGRGENGSFVLSEIEVQAGPRDDSAPPVKVKLSKAEADFAADNQGAGQAIDGKPETGWGFAGVERGNTLHQATFTLESPTNWTGGTRISLRLIQQQGGRQTLGRFRIALAEPVPDSRPLEVRRREHLDRKYAAWRAQVRDQIVHWVPLRPVKARSEVPLLTIQDDGSVYSSGDQTKSDTYEVTFRTNLRGVTALRLEAMPDDRLPEHGPGRVYYEGPFGDFFLSDLKVEAQGQPVKLTVASSSFANGGNTATKAIDADLQSGWSIDGGQGRAHNAVFNLGTPLTNATEFVVRMTFEKYYPAGLGRFRISASTDRRPAVALDLPDELQALATVEPERANPGDEERLRQYFVAHAPELAGPRDAIAKARRELPRPPTTLEFAERPPENPRATFIRRRGEFLQPGEKVDAGLPEFLPGLPAGAPTNRLGFARWLVSAENPLTARVTVNREWAAFFGRGLVRTIEDFGYQGELPTHPELLDWLAVEFREQGWSLKRLHRLIVMSATYQQAAVVTPALHEKDPENLLLARGPRQRLEAEAVRDFALKASGLLSPKIGGPSVFPPQLPNITKEGTYGPLEWKVSEGEDRYRRGLYTFAKRTAPYATFITFDGPSGEACTARREVSNTPLQALTLLNDMVFVEAAQQLGRRAVALEGTDADRVRDLFRRCMTRPPEPAELDQLLAFVQQQRQRLAAGELKAADLAGPNSPNPAECAAWTTLARVLLSLDEAITKS